MSRRSSRIIYLVAPPVRGITPAEDYRINTEGLINVLEAARINGVERVTFGSSGSVYLGIPEGPYPETIPLPTESRNPVEAHVAGSAPDYAEAPGGVPFEGDDGDFCYVKDCAKGIQLITMAPTLRHTIYNVGGALR